MKKLIIFAFATCMLVTSSSFADIQSPPGGKQTRIHKLSRAVANIVYGINEIPSTWSRVNEDQGSIHAASYGIIKGSYRPLVRPVYGFYEFATLQFATYKGSFRSDFAGKSIWWDLNHGYSELAPELGFQSKFGQGRAQNW